MPSCQICALGCGAARPDGVQGWQGQGWIHDTILPSNMATSSLPQIKPNAMAIQACDSYPIYITDQSERSQPAFHHAGPCLSSFPSLQVRIGATAIQRQRCEETIWQQASVLRMGYGERRQVFRYHRNELISIGCLPLDSESKVEEVEKIRKECDFRAANCKQQKMVAFHLLGSWTIPKSEQLAIC